MMDAAVVIHGQGELRTRAASRNTAAAAAGAPPTRGRPDCVTTHECQPRAEAISTFQERAANERTETDVPVKTVAAGGAPTLTFDPEAGGGGLWGPSRPRAPSLTRPGSCVQRGRMRC